MQDAIRYFKLILEYDGTDFHGWQIQPDQRTVQGTLIEAFKTITRSEVNVQGASRTDSGVHAFGQVARAAIQSKIPALKVRAALNGLLPKDVSVRHVEEVGEEFHPRFNTRGKHYRYLIANGSWPHPLRRRVTWHRHQHLDVERMNEAAQHFVGTHDFAALAPSKEDRSTTRTIHDLIVTRFNPHQELAYDALQSSAESDRDSMISIDVAGDGFLWNMVRTIAGTLVEVGRGVMEPGFIETLLKSGDRRKAGPTAPPQGLSLVRIFYDSAPRAVPPQQASVIVA